MKYSQERDFTPVEYMDCSVSCGIMKEKDFLQAESLGVEAPRRYKKCGGCSECSFRADMEKGVDARTMSAETFENCGNF